MEEPKTARVSESASPSERVVAAGHGVGLRRAPCRRCVRAPASTASLSVMSRHASSRRTYLACGGGFGASSTESHQRLPLTERIEKCSAKVAGEGAHQDRCGPLVPCGNHALLVCVSFLLVSRGGAANASYSYESESCLLSPAHPRSCRRFCTCFRRGPHPLSGTCRSSVEMESRSKGRHGFRLGAPTSRRGAMPAGEEAARVTHHG